ncbi:PFE-CTERM domain-containing protein [Thalassoporum mexicanum]|uniref:PFE-CTERM domain-containing protein n=1 Tax=Thalassoporum mexicanum TaxID=3457544 RepID=UPI0012E9ED1A|nr:hypothetical protein [Pseudanabaena sp. PCC 7367]
MNLINCANKAVVFAACGMTAMAVQIGMVEMFGRDRAYAFDLVDQPGVVQPQVELSERQQAINDLLQTAADQSSQESFGKTTNNNSQGGISPLDLGNQDQQSEPTDSSSNSLGSVAAIDEMLDSAADGDSTDPFAPEAIEAEVGDETVQVSVELINNAVAASPLTSQLSPIPVPFNFSSSIGLAIVSLGMGTSYLRKKQKGKKLNQKQAG